MTLRRRPRAFTLVELIVVVFIMMILVAVATPMLSKFAKQSKVQQATQVIMTALYHARSEAQRYRRHTAVYYGDDVSQCAVKPKPGVLPAKNHIEIWTVKTQWEDGIGSGGAPLNCQGDWYTYMDPDRNLTPGTLTIPDGVRVLAGGFSRYWGTSSYEHDFSFWSYNPTPEGELIRHTTVYDKNGRMPGWYDGMNAYFTILVFDEATGEHALIWCGDNKSAPRPHVMPYTLTKVQGNSLTSATDIAKFAK